MTEFKNSGVVYYLASGIKGDVPNEDIAGIGIHGYYYYNEEVAPIAGRLNYAEMAYYDLIDHEKLVDSDDEYDLDDDNNQEMTKKQVRLKKPKGKLVKLNYVFNYSQTYMSDDCPIDNNYIAIKAMYHILSNNALGALGKVVIIERGGIATKLINAIEHNTIDIEKQILMKKPDSIKMKYKNLIDDLYDKYCALKKETKLKLITIPYNVSEYGINIAIANQYKAIYSGRSGIKLNDLYNAHIYIPNNDIKPLKINKHPFIQLKQVIFKKYVESDNASKYRYHFISLPSVTNNKKNDSDSDTDTDVDSTRKDYFNYIGKCDTETIYQIVDITTPIKPIDAVAKQLTTFDKSYYNKMFLGILSEIYKADNYYDLMTYGGGVFETIGSYTKRLIMRTMGGKVIGNEISPPRRVKDAIFIYGEMESLLDRYYNNQYDNSEFVSTDVTNYFFITNNKKVTINPEFKNAIKKINMVINYKDNDMIKQVVYGFQPAYDFPPRSLFLHTASVDSKVTLITWPEVGLGIRYAFVVNSTDATCIWCNWYSNIVLTTGMKQ